VTGKEYQPIELGDWRVEPEFGRISRKGESVPVQPKAMELLVYLAHRNGHVVSASDILDDLWGDVVVASGSVYFCVSQLRDALGDDSHHPSYIETIAKRGYRLIAPVRFLEEPTDARQTSAPSPPASIAVLPFENLSGDPEQRYFVYGMRDALITDLSKVGALKVISRTSTQKYSDTDKPLPQIGAELGVAMLIEGSVYRVDDRVRLTVQLIDAATDSHLWGESYERDVTDVLLLQSELARAIARQIEIKVTPEEEARLAGAHKVDPEIYHAYLLGMYFVNKATPAETAKGLTTLRAAVDKDPANALAWAGLALGHILSAHGPEPPMSAYDEAKAAAAKALELDDTLAEAYAARAEGRLYSDWDWDGAAADFRKALHLNASLASTRAHYSWFLHLFGHIEDALAQMKRAGENDPLTPLWRSWLAWQYWEMGQPEMAIHHARRALELDADFPVALYVLASASATMGVYEEAIAIHKKVAAISPEWDLGLGETYALAGRREEAQDVLAHMEANVTSWSRYFIARVYLALGDMEGALDWLEAAYEEPHHPYIPWVRNFITYDPLRDTPRYKTLMRKMGLPP